MLPSPLLDLLNNWINTKFVIQSEARFKPFPSQIVQGEFVISATRRLTALFSGLPEITVRELFSTTMVVAAEFSKKTEADELRLKTFLNFIDNKFIEMVTQAESDYIKELNPEGFI